MEAARRRVVGFVFPLILVLFEGNVVVNGNTEDVEDHTQLTWVPWRASCPKIYGVHGIDLKGLRGDWWDDISGNYKITFYGLLRCEE